MSKLSVALPWNNSSYIPCNGFHPLYQPLFDVYENSLVNLNVLDEPEFYKHLFDKNYLNSISLNVEIFEKNCRYHWREEEIIADEFIKHINASDLWLSSNLPGDIELHHTSPLTAGQRSFVLHCESFLPVFMPFAYQGIGFVKDIDAVRKFYKTIFLSDYCLGIYSHLQVTLDQLSQFFQEEKIDAKLHLTKIGLATHPYSYLTSSVLKSPSNPTFLFTSSAQQNPVSFGLRGGFSALLFLQKYLGSGRKGKFIFRCTKPHETDLYDMGVDIEIIQKYESDGSILWINQYLPENELLNLFKIADFYLLPSVNLHSVSIMQAQAAGAIPIVTDTYGTDLFVKDQFTGIILTGVREAIWKKEGKYDIEVDDHSLWQKFHMTKLATQMYDFITQLLNKPEKLNNMRHATRQHAKENYDGRAFQHQLFESICSKKITKSSVNLYKLPLVNFEDQVLNKCHQLFNSPPAPMKILSFERHWLFYLKGTYWACSVIADLSQLKLSAWSPLINARNGSLQSKVYWKIENAMEDILPLSEVARGNPILYISAHLRKYALRYAWLKRFLKWIFPTLKPILLKAEQFWTHSFKRK